MSASLLLVLALTAAPPDTELVRTGPPNPVPVSPQSHPTSLCRPHPFEVCGEATFDFAPSRRWGFDDNRFCPDGPGLGCVVPDTGEDPNPGTFFIDSTGCLFEMYVLADCGTEMHLPLFDVESGCVQVDRIDEDGDREPIEINVSNGAGFDETGRKVCWDAEECTGEVFPSCPPGCLFDDLAGVCFACPDGEEVSACPEGCTYDPFSILCLNCPGGPGENRVMDVSFTGDPSLCGVFAVGFESWAGCGWELFSNCSGSGTGQFQIYDDQCAAAADLNPLPELVVSDLQVEPGQAPPGERCAVSWCAELRNEGCADPGAFDLLVEETASGNLRIERVPGLEAGASATICGTLPVDANLSSVPVTVRATVDPDDGVLECTESTEASSCEPVTGSDQRTAATEIVCNEPPDCNAGGPYLEECAGATTPVQLDGGGSNDPDGDGLRWSWTTDCPGDLSGADEPVAELAFDSRDLGCARGCGAVLAVSDHELTSTCEASVEVRDTRPPVIEKIGFDGTCLWPPSHKLVCLEDLAASVQAMDSCDPDPSVTLGGCVSDQPDEAPDPDFPGANGDGHTFDDCRPTADGTGLCLRAERLGTDQSGREYGGAVVAADACGNEATGTGTVLVPHDQDPRRRDCLRPSSPGTR